MNRRILGIVVLLAGAVIALGHFSSYEYDANGNQTAFIDALPRRTTYTHDNLNRRTHVNYVQGNPDITEYDALGRRTKQVDQESKVTLFGYDGLGRLTSVTNAFGTLDQAVTRYKYDGAGNLSEQLDANQSIKPLADQRPVRFEYDKLNRRTERQLPEGQFELFGYDAIGNMVSHTNFAYNAGPDVPNRHIVDFEYDALNRLKKKYERALGPDHVSSISFEYNALGQRTVMWDASRFLFSADHLGVPTHYLYDQFNRLQYVRRSHLPSETGIYNRSYAYDLHGNVITIYGGEEAHYQYDALNRLTNVMAGALQATSYRYDAVGNLQEVKLANSVASTYSYDALNRLTLLNAEHRGPTTTPRATFNYSPSDAPLSGTGKRHGIDETVNGVTRILRYAYDERYRLKQEKFVSEPNQPSVDYIFDKVGNRTARSSNVAGVPRRPQYQYNANDWMISWTDEGDGFRGGEYDTSFDENGNTRFSSELEPLQTAPDEYDYDNRLIKRTLSDGRVIELTYDGDGNRVGKIVTQGTSIRTNRYVTDDRNPTGYVQTLVESVTRYDTATQTAPPQQPGDNRSYLYGLDLVAQRITPSPVSEGSTLYWYGYDGHGSVRFITDDTGTITDTYTYDAFGNLLAETHATVPATPNNYLFAGEYYDFDLGQYYNTARIYNPQTGRFWIMDTYQGNQSDPLSLHKYLYCHADPVNNIDPSGYFIGGVLEALTTISQKVYVQVTVFVVTRPVLAKVGGVLIGLVVSSQIDTTALQGLPQFQGISALQAAEVKFLDAVKRGPIYDSLAKNLKGMLSRQTGLEFQNFLQRTVFKHPVAINKRISDSSKHEVDFELDHAVVEAKHTLQIDSEQLNAISEFAKRRGKDLWYVFVKKPGQAVIDKIKTAGGNVGWFIDDTD